MSALNNDWLGDSTEDLIDHLIQGMGEFIGSPYGSRTELNNGNGVIDFIEKTLCAITTGEDVYITAATYKPAINAYFIKVGGKKIQFTSPAMLAVISRIASNVDVYPMENGCVTIGFSFYNIHKRREECE